MSSKYNKADRTEIRCDICGTAAAHPESGQWRWGSVLLLSASWWVRCE